MYARTAEVLAAIGGASVKIFQNCFGIEGEGDDYAKMLRKAIAAQQAAAEKKKHLTELRRTAKEDAHKTPEYQLGFEDGLMRAHQLLVAELAKVPKGDGKA